MKKCIVSQVHIAPFDPQGKTTSAQKQKLVHLAISHLRKFNPDAYIAFTGHGIRPFKETLDQCDFIYWEDQLRPLDQGGSVIGMPAQFFFLSKGIKHCREKGFDYCLKVRADGLYGHKDIVQYSHDIILSEKKRMLLTQMTGSLYYKMGDCFMYADIDLLDSIWDMNNPVEDPDGLVNTGMHFVEYFTKTKVPKFNKNTKLYQNLTWEELLKKECSFRDVFSLKYMDLRWNYHKLEQLGWKESSIKILDGIFDYQEYSWGKTNNWHVFNKNGKMIHNYQSFYYSEESYYGK